MALDCGHYPCDGQGLDLVTTDFTVNTYVMMIYLKYKETSTLPRGEFTNMFARVADKVEQIDDTVPDDERTIYLFTNINCSQHTRREYPDICRKYFVPDMFGLLTKNLTVSYEVRRNASRIPKRGYPFSRSHHTTCPASATSLITSLASLRLRSTQQKIS